MRSSTLRDRDNRIRARSTLRAATAWFGFTVSHHALMALSACGQQPIRTRTVEPLDTPVEIAPSPEPDVTVPSPEEPVAEAQALPLLTVHVQSAQPHRVVLVGWSTHDGRTFGLLNPVYEAATPTWSGPVPAGPLRILAHGLEEAQVHEGRGAIDMSAGTPLKVTVVLDVSRKLVTRTVVVRERNGQPIPRLSGEAVLDGTEEALSHAMLNYHQWVTDEEGGLVVRSLEDASVKLALQVPLLEAPSVHTLNPGEREITLRDVRIVRCQFRCEVTGKLAPYPGFLAVVQLAHGGQRRYEFPESDALRRGPAILAWPAGATALTVYSSPYRPATITSPSQRCELSVLPARGCQHW